MTMPANGDAVVDTSVLINLAHTGAFRLLGALPFRFLFLEAVDIEVVEPVQQAAFADAVAKGWIVQAELPALEGAFLFAQFNERLGKGESACLAYAHLRDVPMACDEKGAFRRMAGGLVPPVPVFGTVEIYVAAIKAGLISVAQADVDKAFLAGRRFVVGFASYADLV